MPGVILGSPGYMSPEQARGAPLDRRSDIFSFGCVVFEMLAGSRAFGGDSVADAIAAVLHADPDWERLPANTPARVRELLAECLARDRARRLRDIGDARLVLERVAGATGSFGTVGDGIRAGDAVPRRRVAAPVAWSLGVALVAVGVGWLVSIGRTAPLPARSARLTIPSKTSEYRWATEASIAPDGRRLVFLARPSSGGPVSLWLRSIDSFDARPVPETENASSAFWSWDGRSVAFHAGGKLWSVDIDEPGTRRLIASIPSSYGAAWGPTGDIIMACGDGAEHANRLVRIAPDGRIEALFDLDAAEFERGQAWPHFLPDGRRFLFVGLRFDPAQEVRSGRLFVATLDSKVRTPLGPISSGAWFIEPGWLLFVEDGTIKAVRVDADTLERKGEPVTVADGVFFFRPIGGAMMTVSRGGTVVFDSFPFDDELAWFGAGGERGAAIGPRGRIGSARISPDGSQVVLAVSDRRTLLADLWLCGTDLRSAAHLTTDARWESSPIWSRDGRVIYFSWDRRSAPEIHAIRLDDPGEPRLVYGPQDDGKVWVAHDVSPDGRHLLVSGSVDRLGRELRVIALDGDSEPVPFRSSPADEGSARFSPDGRWVAFEATESGDSKVMMARFDGTGGKVQVAARGSEPVWSPTGDAIYFRQRRGPDGGSNAAEQSWRIMRVDLSEARSFESPPEPTVVLELPQQIADFDLAPDGRRFLVRLAPTDTPPLQVILDAIAPLSRAATSK